MCLLICSSSSDRLDAYVDRRLVRTAAEVVEAILHLRHRAQGLLLSELGAVLLAPDQAAAGTKRLSRLLHSQKWLARLIEEWFLHQADQRLQELETQQELALCVWDGSVLEKPESQKLEGLSLLRSSKGARYKKSRPGFFNPASKGAPCLVPGFHWLGQILLGLKGMPCVVGMHWFGTRGAQLSTPRQVEERSLAHLAQRWGRRVVHVFDRGWAGGPWLVLLSRWRLRFLLRWRKDYQVLDAQGQERKASQIAQRARSRLGAKLWSPRHHRLIVVHWVVLPVRHTLLPQQPLWLLVVRSPQWQEPWYLLTSEPLEQIEAALPLILAYGRRWQIEWEFRFEKSELAIASIRVRDWEARRKLLLLVTLVYAFLLTFLEPAFETVLQWFLHFWDHQTGRRARTTRMPLYRLRRALSRFLQHWGSLAQARSPAWAPYLLILMLLNFRSQSSG
jgi:hypothetical protein